MQCYVTGATGYIGRHLIKALLEQGHSVRAVVRPGNPIDDLTQSGVEVVQGEINDEDFIKQTVKGMERVFHLAALTSPIDRHPDEFYRVNYEGHRTVVDMANLSDAHRIVYVSCYLAIGPTPGIIADERYSHRHTPFYNYYHETKYLAHLEAGRYMGAGLPYVAVYPGMVYGPGDFAHGNRMTQYLLDMQKRRFPGILKPGSQVWNLVYIEDVVKGILLAGETGRLGNNYILGGDNLTVNEIAETVKQVTGKPWRPKKTTLAWAKSRSRLTDWCLSPFGKQSQYPQGLLEILSRDWALSSAKAEKHLGYTHISFREGLQKTLDWSQNMK